MAIRSLKRIPIFVWIPPIYSPIYKIEIYDGTTAYDVTDRIYDGEYTDGITETIGNFSFIIDNSDQIYTAKWNVYDKIRIYLDYATTATTLRFVGMIEKVSKRSHKIVVSGRSSATRVMGITVTKSYTNQYTHDIIEDLISEYCSGYITTTNIDTTESTDSQVTVNWYQKPFWECILELCDRATYDAYIDSSFDFHYIVSGSARNTTECVVHTANLIEIGDFTPDLSIIKNRIIVYGAKIEGMQIIWTAEDATSIKSAEEGGYDVKEEIINDSNIITTVQAKDRADYELSVRKDPPTIGEIVSLGLPTLAPAEKLRISDPMSNLPPAYYAIQKFIHKFSNEEPMQTILTVQKEMNTISKILKKRIVFEKQAIEMENPNEMRYSWLFDFNIDSGSHTDTEITDGRLKCQSGQSSGTWISQTSTITSDVTDCELRINGEALPGTVYYVSNDNGTTWASINLNTKHTFTIQDKNLKLKIELNSASTQIEALVLLYK